MIAVVVLFFLYFLFICSLIFFPTGLMQVSSSSSCFFVRETAAVIFFVLFSPCTNRYLFLFSTYIVSLATFSFLSDLLASHSSEPPVVCFVLFCFLCLFCLFVLFSVFVFSSPFFFFFFGLGLFCWALVPGTLALHLLCLDELRLFALLRFTVCDHRICISLG